jgi:hypothetical protein
MDEVYAAPLPQEVRFETKPMVPRAIFFVP